MNHKEAWGFGTRRKKRSTGELLKLKHIYEARHKRKLDEISALYQAEQKGKIEGKIEGILGMYESGVSIDIIAKGMKMSVDEIRQILKDKGLLID